MNCPRSLAVGAAVAAVLIGAALAAPLVARATPAGVRVLAIGANRSFNGRLPPLHYAESDATQFERTMRAVGMVAADNSTLLLDPSLAEVRATLRTLVETPGVLASQKFIFYFSGHSDETGLHLPDGLLPKNELHEALTRIASRTKVAILDSCFSGAISAKGIEPTESFELPAMEYDEPTGSVFLTASSWRQLAFESERFKSSVFTHFLLAGLNGAADNTGDGVVTVDKVYQYVYRNSMLLGLTSPTSARQEPSMVQSLRGKGAIALTFLTRSVGTVVLEPAVAGELRIVSTSGLAFYEIVKAEGEEKRLKIPAGEFMVALNDRGRLGEAKLTVTADAAQRLPLAAFHWAAPEGPAAGGKGGSPEALQASARPLAAAPPPWALGVGLASGYAEGSQLGPAAELSYFAPRLAAWRRPLLGGLCNVRRNAITDSPATTVVATGCYAAVKTELPLAGSAARLGASAGLGQTRHDVDNRVAWAPALRMGLHLGVTKAYGVSVIADAIAPAHAPAGRLRNSVFVEMERHL